jgi:hypothetical protein
VAALHALEHRVDTGGWDDAATPAALQASATAPGLDGAAYVPCRPAGLTVGRDGRSWGGARRLRRHPSGAGSSISAQMVLPPAW